MTPISELDEQRLEFLYDNAARAVLQLLNEKWQELYNKPFDPDNTKIFDPNHDKSIYMSFNEFVAYCKSVGDYTLLQNINIDCTKLGERHNNTPKRNLIVETMRTAFSETIKCVGDYLSVFSGNMDLFAKEQEGMYRCFIELQKKAYPVLFHAITGEPETRTGLFPEYSQIWFSMNGNNPDNALCEPKYMTIKTLPDNMILGFQTGITSPYKGVYYFYTRPFEDRDGHEPGDFPTEVSMDEIDRLIGFISAKTNERMLITKRIE